jgi:hypothetical protein
MIGGKRSNFITTNGTSSFFTIIFTNIHPIIKTMITIMMRTINSNSIFFNMFIHTNTTSIIKKGMKIIFRNK